MRKNRDFRRVNSSHKTEKMCTKYFAVDKKSIFRSNKTSSLISKKNELKSKQSKQKFKNKKVAKPETSNVVVRQPNIFGRCCTH